MRRRRMVIVTECVDYGGTERVVQAVADRFPEASILSAHFRDLRGPGREELPWVGRARRFPVGGDKRHHLAPVYARRMANIRVEPADVLICFTHGGWGLAVTPPPGARVISYSAGLAKALYDRTEDYMRDYPPAMRVVLRAALPALRAHNRELMRRPDRILTNSMGSAAAIESVHGRQAEVVYPPVQTRFFTPTAGPRRHFVAVSRAVAHKRLDVLVEAFRGLDERLVVVGEGRWLPRLRAAASPNVRFTGFVSDEALREIYRESIALVCPSIEEFGIVMAEAHACGVPVIAPAAGGALEIVDRPATGLLIAGPDAEAIRAAVREVREREFDPDACRASAERFSVERFGEAVERVVEEEIAAKASGAVEAESVPA